MAMTADASTAPLTEEQALTIIEAESIDKAAIIALRRATCGFVVNPDGSETRLENACDHLGRGRFFNHKCTACGCKLAWKTTVGFDPVTRVPTVYERVRCPFKKW